MRRRSVNGEEWLDDLYMTGITPSHLLRESVYWKRISKNETEAHFME